MNHAGGSNGNDITARRLLSIMDGVSDGILATDLECRITFFNRAAEVITGMSRQDALGRASYEVFNVHPGECAIRESLSGPIPIHDRHLCVTDATGRRMSLSISSAPLSDGRGQITGAVGTFRDLHKNGVHVEKPAGNHAFADMIGNSPAMRDLFALLPSIAQSNSTVLIEGESGTGKELVARAIHKASKRYDGPLVCVNTNAIPDTLCESELFGYRSGAFTGALRDKPGRFAMADGGTIFLDEIGYMSAALQVKLLRVLQEHEYEPLGSTKTVKSDVRVIAATNRDIGKLAASGDFREDLYYRLNVFHIGLPPLRDRMDDVPLIVDHILHRLNREYGKDIPGIAPEAIRVLMSHNYPGNVRELENIVEHAFVLCPSGEIGPAHLPESLNGKAPARRQTEETGNSLGEMEAMFLTAALKRNRWSRQSTAQELGMSASTLYRKLKRLGLTLPYSEEEAA